MFERFTDGLCAQTADLLRPQGPPEPSPGWKPRDSVAPPRRLHPEGVPAGLSCGPIGRRNVGLRSDPGFHPGLGSYDPNRVAYSPLIPDTVIPLSRLRGR